MPTQKPEVQARRALRPLVAALSVAASCSAWAQEDPNPYYIGASQAFTHDSNVYRIPDGPGDYYSTTGLNGGFDQPVGRQRFYARGNVRYNKYRNVDALDNTSYGANAGWNWQTIEKLSGTLTAQANQSLATANGNLSVPTTNRSLVKTDQVGASARWGGDGLLSIDGDYAHSRVRYSDPGSLSQESSADTGSLGFYYRPGPSTRFGIAGRFTQTDSPFFTRVQATPADPVTYQSNTTDGRNVDFIGEWRYSVQTRVNARLSWTKQTNSAVGSRDFSGLTGALDATYSPTGRLSLNTSISRDAGTNSAFFNVAQQPTDASGGTTGTPVANNGANSLSESQTTDNFAIGANYAATAKISLNAGANYRRSKNVNAQGVTGDSTDSFRRATLGANYEVARNWNLACNVGYEKRTVSGQLGFNYDANTVACSAAFTLR